MKTKEYLKTTDIILFTSIFLLLPKTDFKIESSSEKAVFSILLTPGIKKIINKARLRTLKVEIYAFNAQLRLVKGMIRDHVG